MKKLFGILGWSLIASTAYADLPGSGFYIDGNVGANTAWDNVALDLDGGYMFNQFFGAEMGYAYSPGYSYSSGTINYNTNLNMLDVAAKGVLPLSSQFNLFGKVGIAYNDYAGSYTPCSNCGSPTYAGTNLATLVGAGIAYDLSKTISLHAEDDYIVGPNPNLFLLGLGYKFR